MFRNFLKLSKITISFLLPISFKYGFSLSLPVHSASKNVKVSLGSAETMAVYSNMIFSGWDFCINQRKAAKVKRKNIFTDIQVDVTAFYDI